MKIIKLAFLTLLLLMSFSCMSLLGQTTTWTGNGNGIDWNDGTNWSNGIPTISLTNVIIPTGFTNVQINNPVTFQYNLDIATGSKVIVGSGITVAISNTILLGGGTLENLGLMELNSSVITINGQTTILNNGTIDFKTTGGLRINDGTIINNSIIELRDRIINWTGGSQHDLINNANGEIKKSFGTLTATIQSNFENHGEINCTTGTINITGTAVYKNGTELNCGIGSTLTLTSNPSTFEDSITGDSQGSINIKSNCNVVTTATFDFTNNGMEWNGAILSGGGTLTNLGQLNMTSSVNTINGNTTVINNDLIDFQTIGGLRINDGILENNSIIELRDRIINWTGGSQHNLINNTNAEINKSFGTFTATIQSHFENQGEINCTSGTINVTGTADYNNGSVLNCSSGSTLTLNSNPSNFEGSITGDSQGSINMRVNCNVLTAASFNFTNNGMEWNGAVLSGGGTLTNLGQLNMTSSINTINGNTTVINDDHIDFQSIGGLRINDGSLENNSTIELRDRIINWTGGMQHDFVNNGNGVISKSFGTTTATIQSHFENHGEVNCTSGNINVTGTADYKNGSVLNCSPGSTFTLNSNPSTFEGSITGDSQGSINMRINCNVLTAASFDFTNNGIEWNGAVVSGGGTLSNLGQLNITSTTSTLTGMTKIINLGEIDLSPLGGLRNNDGTLENRGLIELRNRTITWTGGSQHVLDNKRTGIIRKSSGYANATINADFINHGTVICDGNRITFSGTMTNFPYCDYTGNGNMDVNSSTIIQDGNLSPGLNGVGTLVWENDYSQETFGDLFIDIDSNGGVAGVDYDLMHITGSASFVGEIPISSLNFAPPVGTIFDIVQVDGGITACDFKSTSTLEEYNGLNYRMTVTCPDANTVRLTVDSIAACVHVLVDSTFFAAGSLFSAVECANPGDMIDFNNVLVNDTIFVDTTLVISKNLTIEAPQSQNITISGLNTMKTLEVEAGTTVTINGVNIEGGSDPNNSEVQVEGDLILKNLDINPHQSPGSNTVLMPMGTGSILIESNVIINN